MSFFKEGLSYLAQSYCGLPGGEEGRLDNLDKGNLYYKWGHDKGELVDFIEAYSHLELLNLENEKVSFKFDVYEKMLDCLSEILRLRLKKAVEVFEFLCQQRSKIELRDLNFKKELNDVIVNFMDEEKRHFVFFAETKANLLAEELEASEREIRKNILGKAEAKVLEIEQGIEAFYQRVKTYVIEDGMESDFEELSLNGKESE